MILVLMTDRNLDPTKGKESRNSQDNISEILRSEAEGQHNSAVSAAEDQTDQDKKIQLLRDHNIIVSESDFILNTRLATLTENIRTLEDNHLPLNQSIFVLGSDPSA